MTRLSMRLGALGVLLAILVAASCIQDVKAQATTMTTGDLLKACYVKYLQAANNIAAKTNKAVVVSNINARKACYEAVGLSIKDVARLEGYKWIKAAGDITAAPAVPGKTPGRKLLAKRELLTSDGCTQTPHQFTFNAGTDRSSNLPEVSFKSDDQALSIKVRAYKQAPNSVPASPAVGDTWDAGVMSDGLVHYKKSVDEYGLGITNDLSNNNKDNEVNKNSFLQVELPESADSVTVVIDSVQAGETWALYGSNDPGKPGVCLGSGVGLPQQQTNNVAGPAGVAGHKYISLTTKGIGTAPNNVILQNGFFITTKDCPVNPPPSTNLCASLCTSPDLVLQHGQVSACGTFNPCDCCSAGIGFATNVVLNYTEKIKAVNVFDTTIKVKGIAAFAVCQADLILGPGGMVNINGGSTKCQTATRVDVVSGVVTSTSTSVTLYDPSAPTAGQFAADVTPAPGASFIPVAAPTCSSSGTATNPAAAHTITCPIGQSPCCVVDLSGGNVVDSCYSKDPTSYCDYIPDTTSYCADLTICAGCQCVTP